MIRLTISNKWLVVNLLLMMILASCRTLPIATDSSVIIKEYVRDTVVQYKLKKETIERQVEVTDTIYLENQYSQAKAWVTDSKLHGTLQTRDTAIAIALQYPCKTIATVKTNVVEVNKLRWWQEGLIWLGGLCMLSLVVIIVIKIFVKR